MNFQVGLTKPTENSHNIEDKTQNGNYYSIENRTKFQSTGVCQGSFENAQVPCTYVSHLQQTHRKKKRGSLNTCHNKLPLKSKTERKSRLQHYSSFWKQPVKGEANNFYFL